MTAVHVCSDRDMSLDYGPGTIAEAYGYDSIDDVLVSAPRGLPRPRHRSGLPTPWIANADDLADADAFRRATCIVLRLCQVCGVELGDTAVVWWRPGDALVTDGAAMHPTQCWPMALRHCPELARLNKSGTIVHAEVATDSLEVVKCPSLLEEGMPISYPVPRGARAEGSRFVNRRHGTRSRYTAGCHCPDCTAANRAYLTAWRRARGVRPAGSF